MCLMSVSGRSRWQLTEVAERRTHTGCGTTSALIIRRWLLNEWRCVRGGPCRAHEGRRRRGRAKGEEEGEECGGPHLASCKVDEGVRPRQFGP